MLAGSLETGVQLDLELSDVDTIDAGRELPPA
jgi:hypothetical protein